ncbi:MAG: carboxypeptidase regulatory-like domain-containing protein [Acidobacteria bacterium]|nr:carboxypeptidase regulatory-like domain-containing protein [Acidobacteriota bacterium]
MRSTELGKRILRFVLTILGILIFYSFSFGQCLTPPSGLIGWWAGDGNSLDNRGSNHATFVNGPVYTAGEVNQAFSFNGTNQYLAIPQTADLPVRGTNSFTIEAWVRHLGDDSPSIFNLFAYRSGGDDVQFIITRTEVVVWATTAYGVIMRFPHGVDPTVWNHFAFTRSGNIWRAYVNGGQVGTDLNVNVNLPTPSTSQNVGTTGGADTQFALGMLDEFSIYDRALTHAEILAVFNAGTAGKCRQCTAAPVRLAGWWPADNNTLDIRSGNTGIFEGTAAYAAGRTGQAFDFNGSDNDVRIPAAAGLNVGAGPGLTIDGWINPSTLAQNSPLFEWNNGSAYGAHLWMYRINGIDGNLYFNFVDTGSGNHYDYTTGGALTAGRWQHLALTYDKASGAIAVYVDGVPVPLNASNLGSFTPQTSYDFYLGARPPGFPDSTHFSGGMDEVEIFDRALTAAEIRALALAGSAGQCRPTAVAAPAGLVGWWPGDGDYSDLVNNRNGIGFSDAFFAVGKSGQGFVVDGADDYIDVSSAFPAMTSATIEGWVNPTLLTGGYSDGAIPGLLRHTAAGFNGSCSDLSIGLYGGKLGAIYKPPGACAGVIQSSFSAAAGTWYHVAVTDDGTNVSLYVNGNLETSAPVESNYTIYNTFRIGRAVCCAGDNFGGRLDEISLYDRALTASEIQSIYGAGLAGKLKSVNTALPGFSKLRKAKTRPAGEAYSVNVGDASVLLYGPLADGYTQEIPLSGSVLPALPGGYVSTGLVYDLATSAGYAGPVNIGFNLTSQSTNFSELRVLHLENGVWVDRTNLFSTYPILYTTDMNSLSPFAIARLNPTAASVTVSGRVTDAAGNGIRGALVSLTDTTGTLRTARTNTFGVFRFENVPSGFTYVFEVTAKKYRFDDSARVIYVADELTDVDFTALE